MIFSLKSLIGVHAKGDATAAEIEAALAGARTEITAAETAHAAADAAYRAGLLRLNEGELQQLVADQQAATVRRDRATALVEALTGRLAQAQAAEKQAERKRRYEAADRAQSAAAKVLASEYPKLARALVEVLRTVAAADALAEIANEALPDGVERLVPVEARVRTEAGAAERITAQQDFSAWCRIGGTHLGSEDQASVTPNQDGRTGTWKPFGSEPVPVVLRQFRRITRLPDVCGKRAPSLASTLNLPGLRAAHPAFWHADDSLRYARSIVAVIEAAAPGWGRSVGPTLIYEPTPVEDVVALDEPADVAA